MMGKPDPLPKLLAGGDVWVQCNRPILIQNLVLTSDVINRWKAFPEGQRFLTTYESERDGLENLPGGSFKWIGWGPWRVAITLSAANSPVVVVGAGVLAPIGRMLFKRSGFQPGAPVEGINALEKETLTFVRLKGFWIIGSREGVARIVRAYNDSSHPSWWKTSFWPDEDSDCVVAMSPEILRKFISPAEPSPDFEALMQEWFDWKEWGGVVASFEINKKHVETEAWMPLDKDKPVAHLWNMLGQYESDEDWLRPETVLAARINIDDPMEFLDKAKELYATRPGPLKLMKGVEDELRRELHIEFSDLIKHLKNEVGFVNFIYNDKSRTILFAETDSEVGSAIRKMETGITGTWEPGFEGMEIRYMPRLLAYFTRKDKLFIASKPEILNAYLQKSPKPSTSDDIERAARKLSSEPLLVIGRWPAVTNAQSVQSNIGWYAAGVNYSHGRFDGKFTMLMHDSKRPKMPWGPRLLGWGICLTEILGWIIAAVCVVIFVSNALSLNEERRLKPNPAQTSSPQVE